MRIRDHVKPAPDPWFITPDALTEDCIHRKSLEDKIYKKLSVGGARIALVGEGGIGYSITACLFPHI